MLIALFYILFINIIINPCVDRPCSRPTVEFRGRRPQGGNKGWSEARPLWSAAM